MLKPQKRTIQVIAILLMLSASPLSVTYSFADNKDSKEGKIGQSDSKASKSTQEEKIRAILTEKMVDGKLEVRQYALPDDISEEDLQRMVSLEDQLSNGAYVNYNVYHSGIIIFDGKASRIGENLWEISINDLPDLEEIQWDSLLKEKSSEPEITMRGITLK